MRNCVRTRFCRYLGDAPAADGLRVQLNLALPVLSQRVRLECVVCVCVCVCVRVRVRMCVRMCARCHAMLSLLLRFCWSSLICDHVWRLICDLLNDSVVLCVGGRRGVMWRVVLSGVTSLRRVAAHECGLVSSCA